MTPEKPRPPPGEVTHAYTHANARVRIMGLLGTHACVFFEYERNMNNGK